MTGPAATAAVAIKSGKWGRERGRAERARNCPNIRICIAAIAGTDRTRSERGRTSVGPRPLRRMDVLGGLSRVAIT